MIPKWELIFFGLRYDPERWRCPVARLTIFGKHLTQAEIEALKALLDEASRPVDEIIIVDSVGDPDPDLDDEVVVVLGTAATCADADLDADLAKVANGPRRAIWVWPEGTEAAALPQPAAKYSYSIIRWDSGKLRDVVADDDITCFETPAGVPIPKVPTERNCVEEKAKPR
jgi:hypothetical protein